MKEGWNDEGRRRLSATSLSRGRAVHGLLRRLDFLGEHGGAGEFEGSDKPHSVQHQWHPMAVVFPHFVVRNLVDAAPKGRRFVCFDKFAREIVRLKNHAVQAVTVGKLELEFSAFVDFQGGDADLFAGLADDRLTRSFARFDPAARAIDLPGAESALFVDEEDASFLHDEAKHGAFARNPGGPMNQVKERFEVRGELFSALRWNPCRGL